jgi:hypothetical protein
MQAGNGATGVSHTAVLVAICLSSVQNLHKIHDNDGLIADFHTSALIPCAEKSPIPCQRDGRQAVRNDVDRRADGP